MSLVLKFLKNLLFEIVPPVQTVSNEKKLRILCTSKKTIFSENFKLFEENSPITGIEKMLENNPK